MERETVFIIIFNYQFKLQTYPSIYPSFVNYVKKTKNPSRRGVLRVVPPVLE
jgi:hypothetical protein